MLVTPWTSLSLDAEVLRAHQPYPGENVEQILSQRNDPIDLVDQYNERPSAASTQHS
jgi:hypothetical protein